MTFTRRSLGSALAAAAALPVFAPSVAGAAVPVEKVSRSVLANGLEVITIPDHRVPVVTHMLWYRVGSGDEQLGKSGIAHFLEHLMFKGTERTPKDVFSRAVTAVGGNENAFTSYDYTGYYQRIARDRLPAMMDFEADRMIGLALTDAVVDPERDVVLEERRTRTDNDPTARLSERMSAALWGETHPYGIPIIGWEREIRQLNREDAFAFYRQFYAPNNAILVVAGDVTPDEVVKLAEATYGRNAANPAIVPRTRPPGPDKAGRRYVRLADARVAQPSMTQTLIVPSYATARPGEAEALEVLAQVTGTHPNGRMYKALVTEQQIAVSAGAFYSGGALGQGRFGVYATPRPGVTLEQLEAAMIEVMAALRRDGVTQAELDRSKTRLVAESIFSQDSQASMARMYGAALTCGSTVEDIQDWANRMRRVTLDQVNAAIATAFQLDQMVVGQLVREDRG
jgi:zinc protease